jgi:hypothetical protein
MANIPGYQTEAEKAEQLGKSVRTLQSWRKLRIGPPYVKVGNTIIYPVDEGEKWLRDQVQQPFRSRRKIA